MEHWLWIILAALSFGISCEDLTPVKTEEFSSEGSTVTLSYRYSKQATGTDYFFWYRQYPGEPPEFLLSISGLNFTNKAESLGSDTRIFTDLSEGKKRVDLQISSAAVTDSAVYYCAVKPTVTGNTNTLYKNLSSTDITILFNIHQRESLSVRLQQSLSVLFILGVAQSFSTCRYDASGYLSVAGCYESCYELFEISPTLR
ncbi:hypothetical protein JOQ06_022937 [Pogonophryne albipinna]|uniref:Ig-like domain-containing protein n=1 Tax=Pogonophryne albipinna TaxID=1090488 RepID=A0AAD6ACU8_9TELE|nr:hypothetical protein JOQ06_022937 [Pogonophryne albipinna]